MNSKCKGNSKWKSYNLIGLKKADTIALQRYNFNHKCLEEIQDFNEKYTQIHTPIHIYIYIDK